MFSEYFSPFLCVIHEQITSITCSSWRSERWIDAETLCEPLFAYYKYGSLMISMHEAPTLTAHTRTVSADTSYLASRLRYVYSQVPDEHT